METATRPPSKEEWVRFESYTSRVREIHIKPGHFKHIIHFMTTLSMKYFPHPSHHLFPKLRFLICASQETTELPFIHLFLPPSLRFLELTFQDFNQLGAPATLFLLEYQYSVNLTSVLRTLKSRSCQQLQSLDCSLLDESILLRLAQLPTLKNLSAELPASIPNTIASNKGFANLQTLTLGVEDIDAIISSLWSAIFQINARGSQPSLFIRFERLDGVGECLAASSKTSSQSLHRMAAHVGNHLHRAHIAPSRLSLAGKTSFVDGWRTTQLDLFD
ncbi:hypothetical protein BJ138DRAFT_1145078 [Hygrophoropsis aurantiaca]|uniref:Uncharacterized protein n=1 Tax=Hygrophoropsis aurantiaca TaxID=72124 RepID=A0ACB8AKQ0_9AGAM|nr:hypothetical protein BJ138DRAFT_1145078 [Hygrophoropsis aurantiaca]